MAMGTATMGTWIPNGRPFVSVTSPERTSGEKMGKKAARRGWRRKVRSMLVSHVSQASYVKDMDYSTDKLLGSATCTAAYWEARIHAQQYHGVIWLLAAGVRRKREEKMI